MGQKSSHFEDTYELLNQGNDNPNTLSDDELSDDFDIVGVTTDLELPTDGQKDIDDDCLPQGEGEDKKLLSRSNSDRQKSNGVKGSRNYDSDLEVQTISANDESLMSLTIEIFLPFIVAGYGMVGAGVVLDIVQHWPVFEQINELFILVPALLGLKGNLEMTLASRLSTQAHSGGMDTRSKAFSIASSNLALIQVQAIIVGLIASTFAIFMDWLPEKTINFSHGLLLCAASVVTASIASFILGLVMVFVILASRKLGINPDNVATPIAASLGDLVTLLLLSEISSLLYNDKEDGWLAPLLIAIYVLFVPICIYVATRNQDVTKVLYSGWKPVLIAMSISSLGGLILDKAVSKFNGIAVFQPLFNGVGGNLVAVQASRISTYLHLNSSIGTLPKNDLDHGICINPLSVVFSQTNVHSRTSRVLLAMAVPGHFLFAFTISFLQAGHTTTTATFYAFYIITAVIQIWILLCCAHWMVLSMWKNQTDPDNASIPYLTALGDLLGGGLLALTFELLYLIGDRDSDVGDR